ncbi:hypothetical protein BCR43DRAFT_481800 [Syncephalastrum racemosum]|uniref:Uncharacterized protein n=1 Tax=Syncephalastrum racemosum TaxID=13706 RepID=A0A1X2HSR7_SYNRA|nr:hypothetical protein BCR43DRAFT_481800 [Syncephalastrum racemosum]
MYHIGFNTSTSTDRTYKKHDFQCGWRHPFVSGTPLFFLDANACCLALERRSQCDHPLNP